MPVSTRLLLAGSLTLTLHTHTHSTHTLHTHTHSSRSPHSTSQHTLSTYSPLPSTLSAHTPLTHSLHSTHTAHTPHAPTHIQRIHKPHALNIRRRTTPPAAHSAGRAHAEQSHCTHTAHTAHTPAHLHTTHALHCGRTQASAARRSENLRTKTSTKPMSCHGESSYEPKGRRLALKPKSSHKQLLEHRVPRSRSPETGQQRCPCRARPGLGFLTPPPARALCCPGLRPGLEGGLRVGRLWTCVEAGLAQPASVSTVSAPALRDAALLSAARSLVCLSCNCSAGSEAA